MGGGPDSDSPPAMSGSGPAGDAAGPEGSPSRDDRAYPGFEVKGEIGRGGFGAVHLAREQALTRDIALKSTIGQRGADPVRTARFLAEARITAQLQHPGIVPVYRLAQDSSGRPYYTMRPIEGRPLKSILDKLRADDGETVEQFPLRRLARILLTVCQTIRFAH
ncbi:hypothetical protein LCGC14_2524580, partial [marine sediment metagenome]